MNYKIFQAFKCDYRSAKPVSDRSNIVKCPTCGAAICSHSAEMSETVALQLDRDCKFAKTILYEEMMREFNDDNDDANYYSENYDENDNYIGNQDVFVQ